MNSNKLMVMNFKETPFRIRFTLKYYCSEYINIELYYYETTSFHAIKVNSVHNIYYHSLFRNVIEPKLW